MPSFLAMTQARPFYSEHDYFYIPRMSVWVHRPYRLAVPVKNHSVTHCRPGKGSGGDNWRPASFNGRRRACASAHNASACREALVRDVGHLQAFWAYAAPGSGVSINVGRTLVVTWGTLLRLLLVPSTQWPDVDSLQVWPPPPVVVERQRRGTHLSSVRATLRQVSHLEYHSLELRHEIVLLRHNETQHVCEVARCGRTPWLRECTPADCRRFERCTGALSNREVLGSKSDCDHKAGSPKYEARKQYLHWLQTIEKRREKESLLA